MTRLHWANPHVFIYLEQELDDGRVLNWAVEGVNPASLRKIGWSRDILQMGDVVQVVGNPSKNMNSPGIYPNTIYHQGRKLFDEAEFFAGVFTVEEAETGASSLAGVWRNPLNPAVIIPRELEMAFQPGIGLHETTERGREALERFDELTMNPARNCTAVSAPLIMHFGDNKQISIEQDRIRIVSDYDGGERIIHMNQSSHSGATASVQGHSIGRWEDDTLVIDTTHFSENNFGNGFGLPSGPQKHQTEKLTLSGDGKTIKYQFVLSEPEYLSSPMSLESEWSFQPDYDFVIDACDLESARRFLLN